ncbi:MAG: trigger factor [Tannerella sp.]|jgi:trigger factor|nr:trigger factor [Tannerella sp.]
MNISLNNNDALSGVLKIDVARNDYDGAVEKSLREIRQKANMPGFRKGMVPMGMVKKLYGTHVLAEELNKLVAKAMTDYIKDNNINLLGEPIPNETEQQKLDLDNGENFEFVFDCAYRPEINVDVSKEDKLTYYKIQVNDDAVDKQIDSYTAAYGSYEKAEQSEEDDMIKGLLVELADGEPNPDGITVENAIVMPKYMKDKTEQQKFIGAGVGEKIIFNPFNAYEGSDIDLASLLKVEQAEAIEIKSDFSFEIQEITRNKKAELNQELFDRIFGEGAVKDETEFREKVKSLLAEQYEPESEYRFIENFRNLLLDKTKNVIFADDILKRWLLTVNENKTPEDVEREYPLVTKDLRYQLAKDKLMTGWGLTVDDNDVKKVAEQAARAQFAQYGMMSVPDNLLTGYVEKMMEKQETVRNLVERAIEEKLAAAAKEKMDVEEREVSFDEFLDAGVENYDNKE